jgi:hypothetical protein
VADLGQRPLSALPSRAARAGAFAAIVLAGGVGGIIGWAFVSLQGGGELAASIGAAVVAVLAALGTAVLSILVLRAMGEWRPELR